MTEHIMEQPQTEVSAIQPHFSGAILGLQGDVLHGWAMDTTQQEHRPVVEVLIDGASVALVRADQYEPNAPAGDHFHGFAVQLRQRWLDQARLITAQIANQSFVLEGPLLLPTKPNEDSASIASQVWHTGGLRVGGWCWDPKSPNRHVKVTIREGNNVVLEVLCNEKSVALAYRSSSNHGFAVDLPWELADGKVHQLDITNDLGQPLSGSPIRLCCWPDGIEGLVRKLGESRGSAHENLLLAVSKELNMRLPKSAGWNSYPQWFEAFQCIRTKDLVPSKGRNGLLVISDGNKNLEQISIDSLGDNFDDIHEIAIAPLPDIKPALELLLSAKCDRIVPIHAGDRLATHAIPHLISLVDRENVAWGFADCDRDGMYGDRIDPWLKPAWNIELFIGADIFGVGAIFGSGIVEEAINLLADRCDPTSITWHDLMAGVALATELKAATVQHCPRVLYHRASTAPASPELAATSQIRLSAVDWLCKKLAPGASVTNIHGYPALLRAKWPLPDTLPRVSLIVPTRDQYEMLYACIEGLLTNTDYSNLEIIVVDNQSTDLKTLEYLEKLKTRGVIVLKHPYPFNYSAINNRAAEIATGEFIGLINNDIEVIEDNWLKEMIAQAVRPNTGIVGAKLLWKNGMVQHAGVTVGVNGLAAHIGNRWTDDDAGYLGFNQISRKLSAVTAACLITPAKIFRALGGLDQKSFPVSFNDVDYCMRVTQSKLNIVWTPFAKLIHAESASRGKDDLNEKKARAIREQEIFISRWDTSHWQDPFYSASLALDYLGGPYSSLALPPRISCDDENDLAAQKHSS